MKQDIKSRSDVELLVNSFYSKVKTDKSIGYFFTDIVNVNWESHIPIMCDFFENILFYTGKYSGNPMNLHTHLSQIKTIEKKHFNRWVKLFSTSIDELYEGEKATLLKNKVINIASLMQKRIFIK